ncbi:MAG: hypothetical protein NTW73_01785 [Candidatus Parcubacteria bacterium]|nr:hypothetical protein [Candidatus Parcubacteria bacterium]
MANTSKEYAASQSLVAIDQIRDGVIILKNSALRSVLKVSGINFELKSESEQQDIITSWQRFLNNLDFDLQIISHSHRLNIDGYLKNLKEKTKDEPNDLLKIQIEDYLEFIKNFVETYAIIRKTFYIVIPYEGIATEATGVTSKLFSMFKEIFNFSRPAFDSSIKISDVDFLKQQKQLLLRQNNVIAGLSRLGLTSQSLNTEELINLCYNSYNPGNVEKQNLQTEN